MTKYLIAISLLAVSLTTADARLICYPNGACVDVPPPRPTQCITVDLGGGVVVTECR